jgi:hypothetical protein
MSYLRVPLYGKHIIHTIQWDNNVIIAIPLTDIRQFEDTKGVMTSRKSKKDRHHNGQTTRRKRTTMTYKTMSYKTMHGKLKIE